MSEATTQAHQHSVEIVAHRNAFYKDSSHYLMVLVLILLALNALTLYFIYELYTNKPKPRYFATNAQGHLLPIRPLTDAYLTNNELLTWVMEAATATYSFDFVRYREQIEKKRNYFTQEGFLQYLKALKDSNNIEYVIRQKMVVSAMPTGTPTILQEGVVGNRYGWLVEIPMRLTYQNLNVSRNDEVTLTLTIFRIPIAENVKGVGIGQFVMSMRRGGTRG